MSADKICDCNQGRLPCRCKPYITKYIEAKQKLPVGAQILLTIIFSLSFGVLSGWMACGAGL